MRRAGPPNVLQLEEVELPPLSTGEVRLRSLASAINHSDLEIRAGHWAIRREPPFPYVPGLEVVGEVVETGADVADFAAGDRVWTTMQGFVSVRAERDGGYAEYVTVSSRGLAPLPRDTDAVAFASIGLGGVTALEGMRRLGAHEGRRLLVSGATGGVGAAAIEIARAMGVDPIALTRHSPAPRSASVDPVLDTEAARVFGAPAGLQPGALRSSRRQPTET